MSGHAISFTELLPASPGKVAEFSDGRLSNANLGDAFQKAFSEIKNDAKPGELRTSDLSAELTKAAITVDFADVPTLTQGQIAPSAETTLTTAGEVLPSAGTGDIPATELVSHILITEQNILGAQASSTDLVDDLQPAAQSADIAARPITVDSNQIQPLSVLEAREALITTDNAPRALSITGEAEISPINSLTPSQPGSALRPSNVQIPATMPFPQSAAAVLTSQSGEAATQLARTAAPTDAAIAELPLAPSQSGNAHRPSHVQLPADSPFPQSAAAALTPDAEAPEQTVKTAASHVTPAAADPTLKASAIPTGEAVDLAQPIRISDAGIATASPSSDISLVPSQSGPALRPSNVHIPAVTPAPQSAATVLTAQVADIPNILSESLSADDGTKQIKIQLDPPELGRVSIDFKFDGNVLQNVVVTGETPEAMRRLRLMHFELVQTLESYGYTGQDLDFSQRGEEQHNFAQAENFYDDTLSTVPEDTEFPVEQAANIALTKTVEAEGLNLKL